MFCTKCGARSDDGTRFCTSCGADMSQAAQPPQPVAAQPAYQQPYPMIPKKKKHTGLFITLAVLIVIAGAIFFLLSRLSLFKPKDLGVRYTQSDFNSVIRKLGLHIEADLGNGETYDNSPILTGGADAKPDSTISKKTMKSKLSYTDFNWEFSDYQPKSVTLTPAEATAFFNEIAPTFWWFDKTQVKPTSDGRILTSSKVYFDKVLDDLYPDVSKYIPIPLPGSANLYTEGDFSITDNRISMTPEVLKIGPVGIPEKYIQGENLDIVSEHLERFYKIIPDMQINYAGVKNGEFVFDGVIPTEVSVTPKNP